MPEDKRTVTGCLFVADYMEEGEVPAGTKFTRGEAVRAQMIGDYGETKEDGSEER